MERKPKPMLASIAKAAGVQRAKPQAARKATATGETGIARLMAVASLAHNGHSAHHPAPALKAGASFADKIKAEWNAAPEVRREFRTFECYAAWRRRQHSDATGISLAAIASEKPDIAAYVAMIEQRGTALSAAERTGIDGYAATWRASSEIRAEFGTFATYAAYMRAKARGPVTRC